MFTFQQTNPNALFDKKNTHLGICRSASLWQNTNAFVLFIDTTCNRQSRTLMTMVPPEGRRTCSLRGSKPIYHDT